LGHVTGDLGEADEPAALADRDDEDAGAEAAAIAAHAPAFVAEAPGGLRGPEVAVGQAGGGVLGRVETREVGADDFAGLVALDPHRAGVPAAHAAVGVEHVQRVVRQGIDEQAELPRFVVEVDARRGDVMRVRHGPPGARGTVGPGTLTERQSSPERVTVKAPSSAATQAARRSAGGSGALAAGSPSGAATSTGVHGTSRCAQASSWPSAWRAAASSSSIAASRRARAPAPSLASWQRP